MGEPTVETGGSCRSLTRLARREAAALFLAGLVLLVATAAALAHITQPAGSAGCVSQTGTGPCIDGHALSGTSGVDVSPDGASVYIASAKSGAVVRLNRNTATGALTQPSGSGGCVSETGAGPCTDGHGLEFALDVAVSPDGASVYVAADDAVVRLNRNTTTGAISQPAGVAGCVSDNGAGPCADGHGLAKPRGVAVSPDGKSVYVVSFSSSSVALLNRNTTTGAISQPAGSAGCVSETGFGSCADGHGLNFPFGVAVSPDGMSVYAAASNGNDVARLNRNTTTGVLSQPAGNAGCISEDGFGPCANGHGLYLASDVAVSPDGRSVYVAANGTLTRLVRNTTTGAITQPAGVAGCVSSDGTGPCADGHALDPDTVDVSPDGRSVYVASATQDAVALVHRNTTTGAITQPPGVAGCVSQTGAGPCADGHALLTPRDVAVSPDGKSVYATSDSNAVVRFNRTP